MFCILIILSLQIDHNYLYDFLKLALVNQSLID